MAVTSSSSGWQIYYVILYNRESIGLTEYSYSAWPITFDVGATSMFQNQNVYECTNDSLPKQLISAELHTWVGKKCVHSH